MKTITVFLITIALLMISCSSGGDSMQIMMRSKTGWIPARGVEVIERRKSSNWYNAINPISKVYHSKEIRKNLKCDDRGMVVIPERGGVLRVSMPERVDCLLLVEKQRVSVFPSRGGARDFWFDVYLNKNKFIDHVGFQNANDRFVVNLQ